MGHPGYKTTGGGGGTRRHEPQAAAAVTVWGRRQVWGRRRRRACRGFGTRGTKLRAAVEVLAQTAGRGGTEAAAVAQNVSETGHPGHVLRAAAVAALSAAMGIAAAT
jgi:hypothetical protein